MDTYRRRVTPGVCGVLLGTFVIVVCAVLANGDPSSETDPESIKDNGPFSVKQSVHECNSQLKHYDSLGFSITTDLSSYEDSFKANAKQDFHLQIEVNVSIQQEYLVWSKNAKAFVVLAFPYIDKNMAFIYQYINCTQAKQLVWALPDPLHGAHNKYNFSTIGLFRQMLANTPIDGHIVDTFKCRNQEITVGDKAVQVSTVRLSVDLNLSKKILQLKTCDISSNDCTTSYKKTVMIDHENVNYKELKTQVFASWRGQHTFLTYKLLDLAAVQTQCFTIERNVRDEL